MTKVRQQVARFPHRLVGQTDQREGGQAAGELDLDIDLQDLDSLEGDGFDA
nr:hypothetical protein [Telmatospirillum sp. J64-1]